MEYQFTIMGQLHSLNEFIAADRGKRKTSKGGRRWTPGYQMKKDDEAQAMWAIHKQLHGVRITKPVIVHFFWYDSGRRDKDNVSGFGHKVILDAMVKTKLIVDDSWQYVANYTDTFIIDKKNPHIDVIVQEVDYDGYQDMQHMQAR